MGGLSRARVEYRLLATQQLNSLSRWHHNWLALIKLTLLKQSYLSNRMESWGKTSRTVTLTGCPTGGSRRVTKKPTPTVWYSFQVLHFFLLLVWGPKQRKRLSSWDMEMELVSFPYWYILYIVERSIKRYSHKKMTSWQEEREIWREERLRTIPYSSNSLASLASKERIVSLKYVYKRGESRYPIFYRMG